MKNIAWNKRKMRQQIGYLIQNNEEEKNSFSIDVLRDIYNDEVSPFDYSLSLSEKITRDYDVLKEYEYYLDDIQKFSFYSLEKVNYDFHYIDLPVNELLYFVNDYFKDIFPNWYFKSPCTKSTGILLRLKVVFGD